MKNKKQNRELYEKILNATSQKDLDDIKILVDGYTNECNCYLYPTVFPFKESIYSEFLFSGYVYCDDGGYSAANLTINNLPGWVNYTQIGQDGNWTVFKIYGTAPSYEDLPADESDCGKYIYDNTTYSIAHGGDDPYGTCSQSITLSVYDINEDPIVPNVEGEYCTSDVFDGMVISNITITDTDIKTENLRYIESLEILGAAADYIDTNFVPGYAPINVQLTLKNSEGLGTTTSLIEGQIYVTNPYRDNGECSSSELLQFTQSATSDISLRFKKSINIPTPNLLGNLYNKRGPLDAGHIPGDLDLSKKIFLGYASTDDGPTCGGLCISETGVDWVKVTVVSEDFPSHMQATNLNLEHDFRNIYGIELNSYRPDLAVYTGNFNIQGISFNDDCCDPSALQYAHIEFQSTEGLGIYKTGIGPDIDFTGGIGNVEGSYFIGGLDQLATNDINSYGYRGEKIYSLNNKLAVIPNNTGNTFGSEDDSFFLYTFGEIGIQKITHPSATGIVEADGFDNYIAIRYKSGTANTFYKYDISASSFSTGISPFVSDIRRIIAVDNKFWILGDDESVLFDPTDNSYSSVNHNEFTGVSGIPENISIVSPYSFSVCNILDREYPNENYIFAVGTGYGDNNNYFPVLLDTENHTILGHSSSSYITNIELSGYYLDYYSNYKPDIVQNLHRLVFSVEQTGLILNKTRLLACDLSRSGEMDVVAQSPIGKSNKRISELVNNLILWAGNSPTSETVIVDTFSSGPTTSFYETLPITGTIALTKPNYNQFTTLLLNENGDGGYLLNDYELSIHNTLSFTGDLDMGRYGDIALATGAAGEIDGVGGKPNFLLLPQTTYETNIVSGSLVALSTTTTARLDIIFSDGVDDWNIDESVFTADGLNTPGCVDLPGGCCDDTTTPTSVIIGTFVVTDDEFDGGNTLGLPAGYADNNIFEIEVSEDNTSGVIRIKECITFDYESKNVYTGLITGVDPYFPDQPPFSKEFTLTINDVNEPPIGITLTPASASISASQVFSTDYALATIIVEDPDSGDTPGFLDNEVVIADGVNKQYFKISDDYSQLLIREGSVFTSETNYTITLLARSAGTVAYTASASFTLSVGSKSPTSIVLDPITVSIPEETPITSLRHLAELSLIDPDSTDQDEVFLTGPDSTYFSVAYTGSSNSGNLYLNPGIDLDFETKALYTGTLNARLIGTTTPVVVKDFILVVTDVEEPSGIVFSPDVVYIDETTGNPNITFLSNMSFASPDLAGLDMVVTDLAYTTGTYRSALDPFWIINNQTASPEFSLLDLRPLDYETQSIYYIRASGYAVDYPTDVQGGLITVIVRDVNEPPQVTFNPTGISIGENTNTNLGNIKLANIKIQDEQQSSVVLTLTGDDSEFFTIVPSSTVVDDPSSSIPIAALYLNSGVSLDYSLKNTYSGLVVATDSGNLRSTGIFILSIAESVDCYVDITGSVYNATCSDSTDGYISVNFSYTGNTSSVCSFERPLRLVWTNLPDGINADGNGSYVYNLPTGTYNANLFGGDIPITSVSYDVSSPTPMQIVSVSTSQIPCENTGSITVSFSGGNPPYYVDYAGNIGEVSGGSNLTTTIPILNTTSGNIVIRDINNCSVTSGPYVFNFPSSSSYSFLEQSPPLIHDDVLSGYKFTLTHDVGPHEINIYSSTTGEKGSLVTTIDKYDTSVLSSIDKLGGEILDSDGNLQVQLSNTLFDNSTIYTYDIGSKIYPGSYVFEFVNENGCKFLTGLQTASNIQPLSATVSVADNSPVDLSTEVLSQPILDTLFIPYKLIVQDSSVLSYISNITETSDIRLQIGDQVFDRRAIYGSVNCETYSIVNIKFLGISSNDWYFTIPFYKGFDISETSDIDILNQDIYLVISESKKIKVVTELNNNTATVKLLKGSLLTTDGSLSQFKNNTEIQMRYLNTDGSFDDLSTSIVSQTFTLHNKHIPGNIFMIDFLQYSGVTQDLSSNDIESVTFNCQTNQRIIQNYRQFVIDLNNFDNYDRIYFKSKQYFNNNAFINVGVSGGYPDINNSYSVSYKYYNQQTKTLSNIIRNNTIVTGPGILDNVVDGTYILKISDINGNKPKTVNGVSYDTFFAEMVDFIINDLHTTKEALNFEYGDLLINIYNALTYVNPPSNIPGIAPVDETTIDIADPITITTIVSEVSPNTSYSNKITIQTDPGKVKFRVTGPYGYNRVFEDRVELIQLPPGVYNIEGYEPDLTSKYLYQDKRKVFVNISTNILVDLYFDLYENDIIIEN